MANRDFVIQRGSTFTQVLRWESSTIIYRPITGIVQGAPVEITCVDHGVPNNWRVAVVSVKGMAQLNALNNPPKANEYKTATVKSADLIELNQVNASDYKPYISGGYIQYNTPIDLTGYSARMSIKDKAGGTELLRLDTTIGNITLDNVDKTISLYLSATVTASLLFTRAVYDLEMVSGSGVVTQLIAGNITVIKEVTTT